MVGAELAGRAGRQLNDAQVVAQRAGVLGNHPGAVDGHGGDAGGEGRGIGHFGKLGTRVGVAVGGEIHQHLNDLSALRGVDGGSGAVLAVDLAAVAPDEVVPHAVGGGAGPAHNAIAGHLLGGLAEVSDRPGIVGVGHAGLIEERLVVEHGEGIRVLCHGVHLAVHRVGVNDAGGQVGLIDAIGGQVSHDAQRDILSRQVVVHEEDLGGVGRADGRLNPLVETGNVGLAADFDGDVRMGRLIFIGHGAHGGLLRVVPHPQTQGDSFFCSRKAGKRQGHRQHHDPGNHFLHSDIPPYSFCFRNEATL